VSENLPEIHSHSDFMELFKKHKMGNKSWGSAGPDFYLELFDCIGEIKRTNLKSDYQGAVDELYARVGKFDIKKFNAIFIIMKSYIHIFPNINGEYNLKSPIKFDIDEEENFVDFIKNNFNKIKVENHLEFVLDFLLDDKFDLSIHDILTIVLNLDKPHSISNKLITISPLSDDEIVIETKDKEHTLKIRGELLDKFTIEDKNLVKNYIKYNYSSHLHDTKKSNLGKYYTPEELVELVRGMIEPYLNEETFVMDLACGCGAFLELFEDTKIIGRDIDEQAVEILDIFGFENIEIDNSLKNVCRKKFQISNDDEIVIIGNPPYNDVTSKNKRYGTNKKSDSVVEIDEDIKSNDLGRSFLRAYGKLKPKYICVLHPAAYLIKKTNFKSLKEFNDNYRLKSSTLFSSNLFKDMKNNNPFPISASLFELGNMEYEDIEKFQFDIFKSENKLVLTNVETIDGYIGKYPTKEEGRLKKSDIDLYMYNIRDINSLISSGNIKDKVLSSNGHYITVMYDDLYKYGYLNCMKLFFKNNFLCGNLSPIVDKDELENDIYLQDLFTIGMILKNHHRISIFDIRDKKKSIIYTKFIKNKYIDRGKKFGPNKKWVLNIYEIFIKFLDGKTTEEELNLIYNLITNYFENLKKKMQLDI